MRTMERAFMKALAQAHADVQGYADDLQTSFEAVAEIDGEERGWFLTAEVITTLAGTWVAF